MFVNLCECKGTAFFADMQILYLILAYIKKYYYLCSRKGLRKQNKIYTI